MYALYHLFLLLSLVILLWVILPDLSKVYKDGTRTLGRMEKTLHSIYNSCGHLNNSVCAQIESNIDSKILRNALDELQRRHAILQSQIVRGVQFPTFKIPSNPKKIPLVVERRSMPNEYLSVLKKELNMNFEPHRPLIRCALLKPVGGEGNTDLIITVRSDLVDVKSTITILSELIEIYLKLKGDLKLPDVSRAPIPRSTDSLLPSVFPPYLFLSHCYGIMKRHAFKLPDGMPHTTIPHALSGWSTAFFIKNLSMEITTSLTERCEEHGITFESLVYVSLMLATARAIATANSETNNENLRLWGVLVKDMREGSDRRTIGVFFSLLDFVHNFPNRNQLETLDILWDVAKDFIKDTNDSISMGSHLSSMVFTEYISNITKLYSKYFTTPLLCPSFGLQFLADYDEEHEMFPGLTKVKSFSTVHSSTTSFPLPVISCYKHKKKFYANLSFSSETSSSQAMTSLLDEFMNILSSL